MQHRLAVIGSLYENIDLVRLAKKRGYYTIVCDGYSQGHAKLLGDKAYDINVRDTDAMAEMCITEHVDGIIGSFSDLVFEKVTETAEKSGLKWYVKPDMLKYYRDKSEAKKLFTKLGFKVPENKVISAGYNDSDIDSMRFPLVVKPLNGWGSRGIFVAKNKSELRQFVKKTAAYSDSGSVMIEEYKNDSEYNITSFITDGRVNVVSCGYREKTSIFENTVPQVMRIYYPPKRFARTDIIEVARDTLQRFADSTGQRSGVLSMQCFYGEDGLYVCEIAGRIFAYEHDMIDLNSGLSVVELLLDLVYDEERYKDCILNNSFESEEYNMRLYYFGRDGMKIADMDNAIKLCTHKSVMDDILFYNEGETINNNGNKSYFASFSVRADTKKELDEITGYFNDNMSVLTSEGEEIILKGYDSLYR